MGMVSQLVQIGVDIESYRVYIGSVNQQREQQMKQQWTGTKGKRRWFCGECGCSFGTQRAVRLHQEILSAHKGITGGAVQWG